MRKVAAFILSGYAQAAFCVSALAWFAAFVPVTGMLSTAALGLTALKWGPQRAGVVLALSVAILSGFFFFASLTGLPVAGYESVFLFALVQWLPILLIAHLLRSTGSLSFTLNVMLITGMIAVAAAALLVENESELWDRFFNWILQGAMQQQEAGNPEFSENYRLLLEIMTGVAVTSLILVWTVALLLARWAQSLLDGPGGFRPEFAGLKLGKTVAVAGLALFAATSFSDRPLIRELLLVMMPAFLFQGVATVHCLLGALKNAQAWLFAFYASLALSPLLPQLPAFLGILGAVENFADLRTRARAKTENKKEE